MDEVSRTEDVPQTYSEAKLRLDEIVRQVRAKDVSLERSLDLLEEGVKLANQCTELIDQTRWEGPGDEESAEDDDVHDAAEEGSPESEDTAVPEKAGADTDTDTGTGTGAMTDGSASSEEAPEEESDDDR